MINRKKIHDDLVELIAVTLYLFENEADSYTAEKAMKKYLMNPPFRNRVQLLVCTAMGVFNENVGELDKFADAIKRNPDLYMSEITG